MESQQKARRLELLSFKTPQMRAFHLSWIAFFLCFFGWFGIAPLMPFVRDELHLSKNQIGNTIIASVAATILARLIIGRLCDHYGPRIVYTWLLVLGSLPVMSIGLTHDYQTFLLCRFAIGAIGAAFVVTQYHTSQMFASNVVGTANATAAGWGNMGGGVTQMTMPLFLAGFVALGFSTSASWRLAMLIPGSLMLLVAFLYYRHTQDSPDGNFAELKARRPQRGAPSSGGFWLAARDVRVWALFMIYGACFGVELTIHNIAALYFVDEFSINAKTAGLLAGSFGVLALFARTLGGYFGDRVGQTFGLKGKASLLGLLLLSEGVALIAFSQMRLLPLAVVLLLVFGLFVHMSAGATYAIVPFINRKSLGSVAGIVGAGGNAGAVAAGFLFRSESLSTKTGLFWLGISVVATSALALLVRLKASNEAQVEAVPPTAQTNDLVEPLAAE